MAEPIFRVALIGYGLAGAHFHAPFITTTPGLRLTTVVTSNVERQRQVARDHPEVRAVASAAELWRDSDHLDLVVVASANRSHVPLAQAALAHDLSVVVDKPLAHSASAARELIACRRGQGRFLTVFQNRRWDGDFLTLRRLLREGRLGEPLRFESRFERWRPEPHHGWRQSPTAEDAGGLVFDLGSHLIDQALLLFGPVTRVYAELDRRYPSAEVDDDSFVALTHASGVRSHLFMSTMAAESGPRFRVLGTKAAYVKYGLDIQEEILRAGGKPGAPDWGEEPADRWGYIATPPVREPVRTQPGAYQDFYRGVAAALRGEAPPPVDPADAAVVLDLIEKAIASDDHRASTSS